MKHGVAIFPTAYGIPMADLGPACEERGFESLWVAEHSHIPASRESAWPGGAELPQMYYDTLDPFVALTAAAVATSTLKLATGIALVIQRDPIHLAKEAASLDVVSNGRFLLGVGAGWNIEEMVDHGTDPSRRFGRMRESVEAARALWSDDVAEYHGEQIDFGPTYQNPKPVQAGGPPIHVGGVFPGGMNRAVKYADGWIPIGGRGDVDLAEQVAALDAACANAGRDRSEIELSIYYAPADSTRLDELAELGIDRVIFGLPPAGADTVLPILDDYASLIGPR
ncbi:MAG: LLM class F420-dependent oxidoreductase [Actinomycetota bacterium]